MPNVRILANCLVSGKHANAGDEIDVSDEDASILLGAQRAAIVADAPEAENTEPATAETDPPKPRTKAQIKADLEAAQAAEAKLQADLTQATE